MNLTLTPAGLVYIYPIYFSPKSGFNSFIFPCYKGRVRYDYLLESMLLSTYAYMEHRRVAELMEARSILGRRSAYVVKRSDFDPKEYGFLSYKISSIKKGKRISVFKSLYDNIKVPDARRYFVSSIFQHDLSGRGLFFRESPDQPNCKLITKYKRQALWLSKLLFEYAKYKEDACLLAINELKKAIKKIQAPLLLPH